jgi:4-amino-4-deoxy-L-arabinose transferase-like glycosyltransferase
VLFFILLFGALFLWNSWKRDFWEPGEPLMARVTVEMQDGSWIIPSLGGAPELNRPPLTYWLAAACHRLSRLSHEFARLPPELTYRLPSTLAAMLGLWLTFVLGRALFDGRIGFLAVAIQASSYLYFRKAGWLDDDLLFAVSCQLALSGFALAAGKDAPRFWPVLAWIGLAAAALTKSLFLAFGIVLGPLLCYLFLGGGMALVRRGFSRGRSLSGIAIFLLLTVPWYATAIAREGGAFFDSHVVLQHVGRFTGSAPDSGPPYYYLIALFLGFSPWSLFLPLGLLHGKDRLRRDGERLTFVWVLFTLVVLTIASSKKPEYILSIWPALSLLVSAAFFETRESFSVWEDFLRRGVFVAVPYLLMVPAVVVLLGTGAYFTGYSGNDERMQALLADRNVVFTALGIAAAAAIVALVVARRVHKFLVQKEIPKAAFEFACITIFLFFTSSFYYEQINVFLSSREALEKFSAQLPAGAPLAVYGARRPEVLYYLGKAKNVGHFSHVDVFDAEDPIRKKLETYLTQPQEVFLISSKGELDRLEEHFPALSRSLRVAAQAPRGLEGEYVLMSNRQEGSRE